MGSVSGWAYVFDLIPTYTPEGENVEVHPDPDISMTLDEVTACFDDPELNDSWVYRWDFGDGTIVTNNDETTFHSYGSSGTYTISVAVTYQDGSSISKSKEIVVAL